MSKFFCFFITHFYRFVHIIDYTNFVMKYNFLKSVFLILLNHAFVDDYLISEKHCYRVTCL